MSFSLALIQLKLAVEQPGCPMCFLREQTAKRYIRNLLWENVNDIETRLKIIASLGYCPQHTQMLASTEISRHGSATGTNIIYIHLAQVIIERLRNWCPEIKPSPRLVSVRRILSGFGFAHQKNPRTSVLSPDSGCRVCQLADDSAQYGLRTLLNELSENFTTWEPRIASSDGLCLEHLKMSIEQYSSNYPEATNYLVNKTIQRLNDLQGKMNEYVRKHTWDARNEYLTPDENTAWRETLSFFSGYPPSTFPLDNHATEDTSEDAGPAADLNQAKQLIVKS